MKESMPCRTPDGMSIKLHDELEKESSTSPGCSRQSLLVPNDASNWTSQFWRFFGLRP